MVPTVVMLAPVMERTPLVNVRPSPVVTLVITAAAGVSQSTPLVAAEFTVSTWPLVPTASRLGVPTLVTMRSPFVVRGLVIRVPLVGNVTFVAAVMVKVELKAPEVVRFPARVSVLDPLFTPVPP
jgi:hypothetical protein